MSRLYGNQLQSTGRRYYFALDSAPGIVTPAVGQLTLAGKIPAAAQQITVFRSPATLVLSVQGRAIGAPVVLTPAPAALSSVGQIPGEVRQRTITPALPPAVENAPANFAPTLITIWTTQPTTAQLQLQTLQQAVGQGGNIGFLLPGVALLNLSALQFTLLFGEAGVGALNVVGYAPSLLTTTVITPDPAVLVPGQTEPTLSLPFRWVDDQPAAPVTWITDAAA